MILIFVTSLLSVQSKKAIYLGFSHSSSTRHAVCDVVVQKMVQSLSTFAYRGETWLKNTALQHPFNAQKEFAKLVMHSFIWFSDKCWVIKALQDKDESWYWPKTHTKFVNSKAFLRKSFSITKSKTSLLTKNL